MRKGFYDPKTGRTYILTKHTKTPGDAAWVAGHEVGGHKAFRSWINKHADAKVGGRTAREALDAATDLARQNPTVAKLADVIRGGRGETRRGVDVEEALAELSAASLTGDFDRIRSRYGVEVPEGIRPSLKRSLANYVRRIKRILNAIFKKETGHDGTFSDEDVRDMLAHTLTALDGRVNRASDGEGGALDQSAPGDKRRPYEGVPDTLMGFRKNGQNTPFNEQRYPHVQNVRVTLPGGDTHTDAVRGLNKSHALERARRNWPESEIEPIDGDVTALDSSEPSESGKTDGGREIGRGDHGPIFEAKDYPSAVAVLMREKDGEVQGALYHPDIGHADLIYGKQGDPSRRYEDGFGLAKIAAKHPEVDMGSLESELLAAGKPSMRGSSAIFETPKYTMVFRRDWRGSPKTWLLTAFDPKEEPATGSTRIGAAAARGEARSNPVAGDGSVPLRGNPDTITGPRGKDATSEGNSNDALDSTGPADAEQFDKPFPIKEGKLDAARFQLQDKFIDLQRIQEGVEASTQRVLEDAKNVKQAAELFTSKAAVQIEDFRENVEKPIVDFMHKGGLDVREVDDWLTARHAAERNRRMQEINPDVKTGSGMSDAQASGVLAKYRNNETMQRIGKIVDWMVSKNRQMMVGGGLVPADAAAAWAKMYEHYVPLKGFDDAEKGSSSAQPSGRGFDVRGKVKRAFGRDTCCPYRSCSCCLRRF